jgi:nitrate reductase NapE component
MRLSDLRPAHTYHSPARRERVENIALTALSFVLIGVITLGFVGQSYYQQSSTSSEPQPVLTSTP